MESQDSYFQIDELFPFIIVNLFWRRDFPVSAIPVLPINPTKLTKRFRAHAVYPDEVRTTAPRAFSSGQDCTFRGCRMVSPILGFSQSCRRSCLKITTHDENVGEFFILLPCSS